jgi:NAD(P)-dependent dehydrogenase (short-subunit alcohol dehydrogenase family)
VHGRSEERGPRSSARSRPTAAAARFYRADLASLDEVRRLGEAILRDYDRLDVLVNNAGIWLSGSDETRRELSADGHELQLRRQLPVRLPAHAHAAAAAHGERAGAHRQRRVRRAAPIDFDDVMLERDYAGGRGYGQSKLAQVLFTFDLALELEGTGVTVNALHPATLMDTHGPGRRRTPAQHRGGRRRRLPESEGFVRPRENPSHARTPVPWTVTVAVS